VNLDAVGRVRYRWQGEVLLVANLTCGQVVKPDRDRAARGRGELDTELGAERLVDAVADPPALRSTAAARSGRVAPDRYDLKAVAEVEIALDDGASRIEPRGRQYHESGLSSGLVVETDADALINRLGGVLGEDARSEEAREQGNDECGGDERSCHREAGLK
jgi:hypothetical protein